MKNNNLESIRAWIPVAVLLLVQFAGIVYFASNIVSEVRILGQKIDTHIYDESKHMPHAQKDSPYASTERVDALEYNLKEFKAYVKSEMSYRRDWMDRQTAMISEIKTLVESKRK